MHQRKRLVAEGGEQPASPDGAIECSSEQIRCVITYSIVGRLCKLTASSAEVSIVAGGEERRPRVSFLSSMSAGRRHLSYPFCRVLIDVTTTLQYRQDPWQLQDAGRASSKLGRSRRGRLRSQSILRPEADPLTTKVDLQSISLRPEAAVVPRSAVFPCAFSAKLPLPPRPPQNPTLVFAPGFRSSSPLLLPSPSPSRPPTSPPTPSSRSRFLTQYASFCPPHRAGRVPPRRQRLLASSLRQRPRNGACRLHR